MKRPKVRTKLAAAKKPAKTAKHAVKPRPATAAARKPSAARESGGMDLLAQAVASLAAIAAELRQIADDLRDLMSGSEAPEVEALLVTDVESSEEES